MTNRIPGAYAAFRYVTTRFGEGKVYRIRRGPMRGLLWRRYNRLNFWYHLGLFEPHVSRLIESSLQPGGRFWDIGANGGYHSLLAARRVGTAGHVLAVEANPDLIPLIEFQMQINFMSNYTLMSVAVSDREGTGSFVIDANSLKSSLLQNGRPSKGKTLEVPTTTLDALQTLHGAPDVVKIDVEGSEVQVLQGGERLLSDARRPKLLVSTHGQETAGECNALLTRQGYKVAPVEGFRQMLFASPTDSVKENERC